MYELNQYLQKYRSLAPPEESVRKVFTAVLRAECGFSIDEKDVALQRGGAIVSCHPTMRSELMRNSAHVLSVLQKDHNVRLAFIR